MEELEHMNHKEHDWKCSIEGLIKSIMDRENDGDVETKKKPLNLETMGFLNMVMNPLEFWEYMRSVHEELDCFFLSNQSTVTNMDFVVNDLQDSSGSAKPPSQVKVYKGNSLKELVETNPILESDGLNFTSARLLGSAGFFGSVLRVGDTVQVNNKPVKIMFICGDAHFDYRNHLSSIVNLFPNTNRYIFPLQSIMPIGSGPTFVEGVQSGPNAYVSHVPEGNSSPDEQPQGVTVQALCKGHVQYCPAGCSMGLHLGHLSAVMVIATAPVESVEVKVPSLMNVKDKSIWNSIKEGIFMQNVTTIDEYEQMFLDSYKNTELYKGTRNCSRKFLHYTMIGRDQSERIVDKA